jgi:hypothetical protein
MACQRASTDHRAAAARAAIERARGHRLIGCHDHRWRHLRNVEELPAERQLRRPVAIGEEAVMADAVKAIRQGVEQKAPDELVGAKGHGLRLAVMAIVLPAEGDVAIGHGDQARVGDCDAMGVAAEIGQHLGGAAERRLGADHALDPSQLAQAAGEGGRFGEIRESGVRPKYRLNFTTACT